MSNNTIKLNVPFYKNDGDGSQCMQVALKMAISYFLNCSFNWL